LPRLPLLDCDADSASDVGKPLRERQVSRSDWRAIYAVGEDYRLPSQRKSEGAAVLARVLPEKVQDRHVVCPPTPLSDTSIILSARPGKSSKAGRIREVPTVRHASFRSAGRSLPDRSAPLYSPQTA